MKDESRIPSHRGRHRASSSDSAFQHQIPADPFTATLNASSEVAWGIHSARNQCAPGYPASGARTKMASGAATVAVEVNIEMGGPGKTGNC